MLLGMSFNRMGFAVKARPRSCGNDSERGGDEHAVLVAAPQRRMVAQPLRDRPACQQPTEDGIPPAR